VPLLKETAVAIWTVALKLLSASTFNFRTFATLVRYTNVAKRNKSAVGSTRGLASEAHLYCGFQASRESLFGGHE
jgi:hypothetical protein